MCGLTRRVLHCKWVLGNVPHSIFVQRVSPAELSSPTGAPTFQGPHDTCILGTRIQGSGGGVASISIAGQERGMLHQCTYPGMDTQTDVEVSL